jgi:hypothetical protein
MSNWWWVGPVRIYWTADSKPHELSLTSCVIPTKKSGNWVTCYSHLDGAGPAAPGGAAGLRMHGNRGRRAPANLTPAPCP